jgi:hypothetical protein
MDPYECLKLLDIIIITSKNILVNRKWTFYKMVMAGKRKIREQKTWRGLTW